MVLDREDDTKKSMISLTLRMKKRRMMMIILTTMAITVMLLCISCHLHADHELRRSEHYSFLDVPEHFPNPLDFHKVLFLKALPCLCWKQGQLAGLRLRVGGVDRD